MSDEEKSIILAILREKLPSDVSVHAFGSRASGHVKPWSDLDLVVEGPSPLSLALIGALAEAFATGRLSAAGIATMDDAAAIAAITSVRGMGPWSAEIYLLFALGRENVFPAGDIAVAGACAALKGLATRPDPVALRLLAEPWRPWRSLAARLLWHHWRHITGRPAIDDLPTP